MRYLLLCLTVTLFWACEKDPEVNPSALEDNSLSNYLLQFSEEKTSNNFVAFAGNHPDFEDETNDEDLHLYLKAHPEATDFRLYQNDSLEFEDSLNLYASRTFTEGTAFGDFLTRISLPYPAQGRWLRISYVVKDSLFLSDPIELPGKKQVTSRFDELSAEQEAEGRATFRWNDGPLTPRFVLMLSDRSGDVFCAITTRRDRFRFHDLRNIDRDLTPELFDPQLVIGETYTATLFGISNDGWADRYSTLVFIHE